MREQVAVADREKRTADGTAEITRYSGSQRMMRAVPVAVGGTILGLCTIVVPGVHFISTWLVPLLSIGIGVYLYKRLGLVDRVQTTCPSCEKACDADGGAWEDPMWVRCSACQAPLQVTPAQPMSAG